MFQQTINTYMKQQLNKSAVSFVLSSSALFVVVFWIPTKDKYAEPIPLLLGIAKVIISSFALPPFLLSVGALIRSAKYFLGGKEIKIQEVLSHYGDSERIINELSNQMLENKISFPKYDQKNNKFVLIGDWIILLDKIPTPQFACNTHLIIKIVLEDSNGIFGRGYHLNIYQAGIKDFSSQFMFFPLSFESLRNLKDFYKLIIEKNPNILVVIKEDKKSKNTFNEWLS